MQWIDFPALATFVDRSGVTRSIRGCALMGRFEFFDLLNQFKLLLDEAAADFVWEELYATDRQLRAVVDRMLYLNGLDPDWLSAGMIEQFLIGREVDGVWLPGYLLEIGLGQPKSEHKIPAGEEPDLAKMLALLSGHCSGLVEAIDLAQNVPAGLLLDAIAAKAELSKTPEQRADEDKQVQLQYLKENYGRLLNS